jgi:DNA-binding XRE family transcriptional regulator
MLNYKKYIDKYSPLWNCSCTPESRLTLTGDAASMTNSLRRYRERLLLSKTELARKAGLSSLTIDRVEKGKSCRMSTKRKIILALGLKISQGRRMFRDD